MQSPKTTIQAVFPYIPPSMDEAKDSNQSSLPQVVEIPVLPRSYTFPESHYSETPMSVIDSDFQKQNVYDISKVLKTWADVNVPQNSNDEQKHTSGEQNLEVQSKNEELSVPDVSCDTQELSAHEASGDTQELSVHEASSDTQELSVLESLSASNNTKDNEVSYLCVILVPNIFSGCL